MGTVAHHNRPRHEARTREKPARLLLKAGTLGTALYGVYRAYAYHATQNVAQKWRLLAPPRPIPLEHAFLLYLFTPHSTQTLRASIQNTLKKMYCMDVTLKRNALPEGNLVWANYAIYMDAIQKLLLQQHDHSTQSNSLRFVEACLALFPYPSDHEEQGLPHDSADNNIEAYLLYAMKHTLDHCILAAVLSANQELKRKGMRGNGRAALTMDAHTSAVHIVGQCVELELMNTPEANAFAHQRNDNSHLPHVIGKIISLYEFLQNSQGANA